MLKKSLNELKEVKNLCMVAVLIAMNIVIRLIGNIRISAYLYISFSFLVSLIVGTMFGPVVACLFGFLADVIGYFSLPQNGPFHWGFTLNSIVAVLIYAVGLYKIKLTLLRVVVVQIIHDVVVLIFLNNLWLSQMYFNNNFYKAFIARVLKQFITLPINCILACCVAIILKRVVKNLKIG